ncbi:DUF1569 domain-containing protein [Streptomyces sp. NPDC059761]|uniref:DUF1569 domain-containing protein n=1 Tax=Streptomyces sp. NPDC059761 TaxID=3346937 RepID=UPI0036687517
MAELRYLTARLSQASRAGALDERLLAPGAGWNLSQTLQHCTQTVSYSVTGYPRLRPRLFRLTAGRLVKTVFLRRAAMRHPLDAEIAGAPALDPALPPAAALDLLTDAVTVFSAHTGEHPPHPAYGPCTHAEYAALHAMHLAEHLPGLPGPPSAGR